jgi:hypothetical protein
MKTRTLARRMARVSITPTAQEKDRLARAAAEAEREEASLDLHTYLRRGYQAFIQQFPPGYEPLSRALEAWGKAADADLSEGAKEIRVPIELDELPPISSVDSYGRIYSQPANRKPR